MRFPSFIKLPRHKHYEIQPRYYDPIKEQIAERTEKIKREMAGEAKTDPSRISFQRRADKLPSASFLQLIIAATLCLLVVGWLNFGNDIVYALFVILPAYLFLRLRKMGKK